MYLNKKIALVHDWLTGMRGGEKVLEIFCEMFPHADIFTLLHIPDSVSKTIESHSIRTSYLQNFPGAQKHYRYFLPLMPHAIQSFDLSAYDWIISTSHCVAKGCRVPKQATHISYCFTPMRYIWDQFENYFGPNRSRPPVRWMMNRIRPGLQSWDVRTAQTVGYFVADSRHVQTRIKKYYGREAQVIYPPADLDYYTPETQKSPSDFYLVVSALAPYKRIDIAIQAFNTCGKKLKVIGNGQSSETLKAMAKPNIEFLGWRSNEELRNQYRKCKALIFPGVEDFGIVPVEAMACGTPVIAFAEGGALETVQEGRTGIFFKTPTEGSLLEAIRRFEGKIWDSEPIREHSLQFSKTRFRAEFEDFIKKNLSPDAG